MKSFKQYLVTALLGAFVLGFLASAPAKAESNPFVAQDVAFSAEIGDGDKEKGKCGEGKCGEGKKEKGKCGEGKCGEGKKEKGKCGEGKCGEGKCGEGKKKEGKCGEGKCGE